METTARLAGLAMSIASVVVFALLLPRGGRVSPILRTDFIESIFMMALIGLLFSGIVLALGGLPQGMSMTTVR